jgi:Icc-related predicted phosphoesterase
VKICAISDMHGYFIDIPKCDVFIIAGDINYSYNDVWFMNEVSDWLNTYSNKFDIALIVFGNHDDIIYMDKDIDKLTHRLPTNVKVLINDYYDYKGYRFYGSPNCLYIPYFKNTLSEIVLKEVFSKIPKDTDVLITHSPPYGIGDVPIDQRIHLGSKSLLDKVKEVKPKIHIFGHIHSGQKYTMEDGIEFYNVSITDEGYNLKYKPTLINIKE